MKGIEEAVHWILARDSDLNADQRLARWVNLSAAASLVLGAAGWVVGWILSVPWQLGLFLGLVLWVVLLNTLVVGGRRDIRKREIARSEELKDVVAQLHEVERERDDLRAENESLKYDGTQRLRQLCSDLSPKLFRFAQERDAKAPPEVVPDTSKGVWSGLGASIFDPGNQERSRYDDETRRLYSERYGSEVAAALDGIEQREWMGSKERKELESELTNFLFPPTQTIRKAAQKLGAAGKRI